MALLKKDYAALLEELRAMPDTDAGFVSAISLWIGDYERLELLEERAQERFKAALDELERYQAGRFGSLQAELDVIEGEVLPPVAPARLSESRQPSRERRQITTRANTVRHRRAPTQSLGSDSVSKKVGRSGEG
ncbi:MAG: hypothetical protein GEU95_24080 [Rhizobiales bacterium]|nr:hypothetical protein [Hyphomicrobiales bacterium]